MSLRVGGSSPQAPAPEEQTTNIREHRVEKAVVHALDKAALSTLSITKFCFGIITEVNNWGALAAWIVLALPTGIISGVFGGVLWGAEKLAETVSGGHPIALDDPFDRVMGCSEATIQGNVERGWLSQDSRDFLLKLKGEVTELRRDFSKNMEALEKTEQSILETDAKVSAEIRKIAASEREAKEKIPRSDVVQYNKELQHIEEKYEKARQDCRKQSVGTISQVAEEKKTLSHEFEKKLNALRLRYEGYVQEKNLQLDFREYSKSRKPALSFEAFKEARAEASWKKFVEEVPDYKMLSLKEYARSPKKYENIYSLYTTEYKSYVKSQQSQGKPVQLWSDWKETNDPF